MKRKINGRRSAPPTKRQVKFQKVKLRSIYMSPLELILSEIPEKIQCPPPEAAGRKNPKNRFCRRFAAAEKSPHEKVRRRRTKFCKILGIWYNKPI
jgi:hypothetical protein